jgi:hypothetical protein
MEALYVSDTGVIGCKTFARITGFFRITGCVRGWLHGQNVSFGTGDYTSPFSILLTVLNDSKKAEREANEPN